MSAKLEMSVFRRFGLALLLGLLVTGCGSKGSVSLDAHIEGATLKVTGGTLGTQIDGGFTLVLKLGSYASKSTQVTVQSFSVVGADNNATVLDPLAVGPDPGTIDVGVGKTKNIAFKVDNSKVLPASDKASLCAGPVVIVGTVTDTLAGGKSIPLQSARITVSGC